MKQYWNRLKQKIQYNSVWRLIHDGLVAVGIKITPFYLVVEGLYKEIPLYESDAFNEYRIECLSAEDMKVLGTIPTRKATEAELVEKLEKGCVCLGVKHQSEIVAFTWFNLAECPYRGCKFALQDYEAYLFDAYVLIEHRGKKIAPFMRYQCYKELKKMGRTTLYSISELANNQSIRFKKKLDAQFVMLGLYIRFFFSRWHAGLKIRELVKKEDYVRR